MHDLLKNAFPIPSDLPGFDYSGVSIYGKVHLRIDQESSELIHQFEDVESAVAIGANDKGILKKTIDGPAILKHLDSLLGAEYWTE